MIKSLEGGWSWEEGALGREEQRTIYIYCPGFHSREGELESDGQVAGESRPTLNAVAGNWCEC